MKIAFLNIYNGVINRGAETFVKEVASRLAVNHGVFVFQSGGESKEEKYTTLRIPVKWNWSNMNAAGTLKSRLFIDYWSRQIAYFTVKCMPQILKQKFDIVIPVNGGWMPALLRIITWLYGGKMVVSGQAGIGWDERNNLLSFPNAFVSLSTHAKSWAEKINPITKVEYIPNGVDFSKFTPKGVLFQSKLKRPTVLCVGALTPTKRIGLAIKAVSCLKNASFLVVGDGDMKMEIKKTGEKLLGDRFKLVKLPFEKMPEVYRCADVFTIPSESFYSFETVLVEAMASGLPVVANDDPIRREIVGNAGILVDPRDTEAYAESLEKALNTNWGDKPIKQAIKFDWDKITRKYEELFEEII